MKKFLFIAAVFLILILHWIFSPYYICEDEKNESAKIPAKEQGKTDSTVTVTFSAVGDIMCHSTQYNYAKVGKDSFDFKPVFNVIGNYLRSKDVLFGNFETVLAGSTKKYFGYPFFNTPNEFAEALQFAGFDFLFTANNHANDQGVDGIKRTIDILNKLGIVPIGTKKSKEPEKPKVFVKKGLKFGVLAYTYGTNYNENSLHPKDYVQHIHYKNIKYDIEQLRNVGAEIVIVYFHFGKEYEREPTKYQLKVVNKTVSFGADIILASHPHIVQKFEKFKTVNATLDTGFVTYSLGNFLSNQRWRYSDGGLIFNFNLTKNIFTDSVYISEISFLPVWVFKGKVNNKNDYRILPAEDFRDSAKYNFTTAADIDSMKKSYFDTIELFTEGKGFPKEETINNIQ